MTIEVLNLRKAFGGNVALDSVSFAVGDGELVALVGPNGSGKTTVLNIVSGHYRPSSGDVLLDGRSTAGLEPEQVARRGILRMFQLTRVFLQLSTYDNMMVAGLALGLSWPECDRRALALLKDVGLQHLRGSVASSLSGGQKKLLEFAMCFITKPRLALLDEPFAAVHPAMKETMASFIVRRRDEGQAFLLVSHDMPVVAELCPRTICMNAGRVLADGPTGEVLSHPEVVEAYLGGVPL